MIDWSNVVSQTTAGIINTVVLFTLGKIFLDRYAKKVSFANKISKYGFGDVSPSKLSQKDVIKMCYGAKEIKMIYVSGVRFLEHNRKHFEHALKRNCTIKFLCAEPNPNSTFLTEIEEMEKEAAKLSGEIIRSNEDQKIWEEIRDCIEEYRNLGMQIRHYASAYRLPLIIANYPNGKKEAWLTVTLPPNKSTQSFILKGTVKEYEATAPTDNDASGKSSKSSELDFIEMMETHFDAIWDYYSTAPNKYVENPDTTQN